MLADSVKKHTHDDIIEAKEVYFQLYFERYKGKLVLHFISLSVHIIQHSNSHATVTRSLIGKSKKFVTVYSQYIVGNNLVSLIGPDCEKTCLWRFRQCEFQTSLLSYRNYLEKQNFTCSKFTYETFKKANNKGADQTARKRRLLCACVVGYPPKDRFCHVAAQSCHCLTFCWKK